MKLNRSPLVEQIEGMIRGCLVSFVVAKKLLPLSFMIQTTAYINGQGWSMLENQKNPKKPTSIISSPWVLGANNAQSKSQSLKVPNWQPNGQTVSAEPVLCGTWMRFFLKNYWTFQSQDILSATTKKNQAPGEMAAHRVGAGRVQDIFICLSGCKVCTQWWTPVRTQEQTEGGQNGRTGDTLGIRKSNYGVLTAYTVFSLHILEYIAILSMFLKGKSSFLTEKQKTNQ